MSDVMVLYSFYIVVLLGIFLYEYDHEIYWLYYLLVLNFGGQVFMIGMMIRQIQMMQLPTVTSALIKFEKLLFLWTLALVFGGSFKGTDCTKDKPYPEAFFLMHYSHFFLYLYTLALVSSDFFIYPPFLDPRDGESQEALLSNRDYNMEDN